MLGRSRTWRGRSERWGVEGAQYRPIGIGAFVEGGPVPWVLGSRSRRGDEPRSHHERTTSSRSESRLAVRGGDPTTQRLLTPRGFVASCRTCVQPSPRSNQPRSPPVWRGPLPDGSVTAPRTRNSRLDYAEYQAIDASE